MKKRSVIGIMAILLAVMANAAVAETTQVEMCIWRTGKGQINVIGYEMRQYIKPAPKLEVSGIPAVSEEFMRNEANLVLEYEARRRGIELADFTTLEGQGKTYSRPILRTTQAPTGLLVRMTTWKVAEGYELRQYFEPNTIMEIVGISFFREDSLERAVTVLQREAKKYGIPLQEGIFKKEGSSDVYFALVK